MVTDGGEKMYYPNLIKELGRKNISNKAVAAAIGCTEKTLYNKMMGKTDFTWGEVTVIENELLPEFKLSYLLEEQPSAS